MSAGSIILEVAEAGISLYLKDGALAIKAPKGALTPELREKLKKHKAEIIESLQKTADTQQQTQQISPRDPQRETHIPLSYSQSRLWLIQKFEPEASNYNVCFAVRFTGQLVLDALSFALNQIVQRHEVLRTVYHVDESATPFQKIREDVTITPDFVDISDLAPSAKTDKLEQLINEESCKPFRLDTDSTIRTAIVKEADDSHVLLLTLHHIASDGWSSGILTSEITAFYTAYIQKNEARLPELPIQYADYAIWQRETLSGEMLDKQLGYWTDHLRNIPVLHNLSLDKPRPSIQQFHGDEVWTIYSAEQLADLNRFAKSQGVTLFMLLNAAFSALLARHSGQNDIVLGTSVANREQAELANMVGCFANTLVLRSDLDGNPRFDEFLQQTKTRLLQAYQNQQIPIEKLIDELQPERSFSHTPLFQVMLLMQNNSEGELSIPGANFELVDRQTTVSNFDLTLDVKERDGKLLLRWEYAKSLFFPETIQRMAKHFEILLQSAMQNPQTHVESLACFDAQERDYVLNHFNQTQADVDLDTSLPTYLEQQAAAVGSKTAVIAADGELTYAELNCRVNKLAHYLQEQGVKNGQLVGLCTERNSHMLVGLLAIMKAGGAYVPIDPTYPESRIEYMLTDAKLQVIVTESSVADALPNSPSSDSGAGALLINADNTALFDDQSSDNLAPVATKQQAYMIYTSGSTGNPKGVMLSHRNLINFLLSMQQQPGLQDDDVLLAVTSTSFDIHTLELFLPLVCGATVVIASKADTLSPTALSHLMATNKVTAMQATPATWKLLLNNRWQPTQTMTLMCGGEALSESLKDQLLALQNVSLWNMYGPTETSVWSSVLKVDANETVRIGGPIANTTFYVLDAGQQPVPFGVVGELYIGGEGVAQGYFQRPELTAEKFIRNPFGAGKIYATGDLVRWLPNGCLEYVGRSDAQVKVRGHRIELGEVETAIGEYQGIQEAVVVARDEPARLVAYFVADSSDEQLVEGLRRDLNGRLPIYMVPSLFMQLDAMPLTPNGKIDRRALPEPDLSAQQNASYTAPRNDVETELCELWCEILGQSRLGIHDNFFEFGGHSLSAARLAGEVQQRWQIDINIKDIFEQQTIADLAQLVADSEQRVPVAEITAVAGDTFPLSFAQQRLWLIDQIEPNSSQYNMPFALRLHGTLHADAMRTALTQVVERHSVLRTQLLRNANGEATQRLRTTFDLALPITDVSQAEQKEAEIQRLATEAALTPFNLSDDLLIRAELLKAADDDHVLLVTVHHISFDAWSIGLVTKELVALYESAITGKAAQLPELPIQYKDYAVWQHEHFAKTALETHLTYWKQQLAGIPTLHSLPLDKARPAVPTYRAASVEQFIPNRLLEPLKALAKAQNASLFMLVHAALATVMHRYSNENDIVIGTTVANRQQASLQSLVGFFINSLVLRVDFSAKPSFNDLLAQARDVALDAFAHQEMPFEQLVDECQPERNLSHNPMFQVMLTLHNTESADLALPGLQVGYLNHEQTLTPFDLSLDVYETDEGLRIRWELATDIFTSERIERMAVHMERLLESAVAAPEQAIHTLAMLTEQEQNTLLNSFNGVQTPYAYGQTMHGLFEAQVQAQPEAVAVVHNDRQVSYQAVNQAANRLAHYLIEQGVQVNDLVGIYAQRTPEFLIAVLAVMKAGGAYVPLDPVNPIQRIDYMIGNSQCQILLCDRELAERYTPVADLNVLFLDDAAQQLAGYSSDNPQREITGDDTAYMIYTSGSTGNPKGALVHHEGALNHVFAEFDVLGFMTENGQLKPSNFLQSAATSSDVSVWQFLAPVVSGGQTVILDTMTDMPLLVEQLQQHRVHLIQTAPVVLQLLVSHLEALPTAERDLGELAWLMTIAEPTPVSLINRWFALYPDTPIMNGYGPSEASDDITQYIIRTPLDEDLPSVPVGIPLPNLSMYVLNDALQMQPVGVVGELCVAGVQVGPGYWNNPEKTAAAFCENPYNTYAGHGKNLYRTGDLGLWLEDGNLALVGRIDNQVKVRGFRVELGEVEAALAGLENIADAAVLLKKNARNENFLAAYLVAKDGKPMDRDELRDQLVAELPEYMMPSSFTWLDKMPLNAADKIDRHRLPEPDLQAEISREYVAPTNQTEQILCDIWQGLLGLEQVGITDNFFGIGGDSILSVQVASRASQAGVFITLRQLFEHQTIRELAAQASSSKQTDTPQTPVLGEQVLLPIQRDFMAFDKVEQHHYNLSVMLSAPSSLTEAQLTQVVAALYQRHDVLRLRASGDADNYAVVAQYLDAEPSTINECVAQSVASFTVTANEQWETELADICAKQQQAMDLTAGPVFRATLISDGAERNRLQLIMHHMICDGISWRVLIADIAAACEQLAKGDSIQLADKTSSFQQWGEFLAEYANSEELAQERDFWQQQLGDSTCNLPVDSAAVADNSWQQTQEKQITLDEELTTALLKECHHAYGTQINDLLLSAIYMAVADWSQQRQVRVYLEGHGREALTDRLEFGETLGWFTSVYPVLFSAENLSEANVLVAVKEQLRAVPNNGIGFGLLTEMSDSALSVAEHQHLSQSIMFNYLGQFDNTLAEDDAFTAAPEGAGREVSENRVREHQLGFTGAISDGCLSFRMDYNPQAYNDANMQQLADKLSNALQQIIEHCQNITTPVKTPSDYPLAALSISQLREWQAEYGELQNVYPATAMQQGLLFHSALDASAYVSQVDVTLHGDLDIPAFQQAWQMMLSRHAVLRTAFVGQPAQQVVVQEVTLPWKEVDLSALPASLQEIQFNGYQREEKQNGFPAEAVPLMRLTAFKLADKTYRLLWSYHHALLDGWSSPLVMAEVVHCYNTLSQGLAVQLPPVPEYAGYIGWLQQQDEVEAKNFWKDYLSTIEAPTPLGIDNISADSNAKRAFEEISIQLSEAQTNELAAFAKNSQITLNTVLQAAWAYLLHAYSGESQVVFGETVSGRPADLDDVESIVGLFINTVPVKVNFDTEQPLVAWLQQQLKTSVQRSEFSYLPLTEISQLAPDASANLFDSLVVFENYPAENDDTPTENDKAISVEAMNSDEQTNFKLTFVVVPGDALKLRIGYQTNAFSAEIIQRLGEHLQTILFAFAQQQSFADISLLNNDEVAQLVNLDNNAQEAFVAEQNIAQAFSAQAAKTPEAIALQCADANGVIQTMTYAQLDAKSTQIAAGLVASGVQAEDFVAVSLPRQFDTVVSILAILKANAAYVPVDPEYPAARIAHIIQDSKPRLMITETALAPLFADLALSVETTASLIDAGSANTANDIANITANANVNALAYVMYTSGSTGLPKGVMVEQASVLRLVQGTDFVDLSEQSRCLHLSPTAFDASTFDIWGPLLNGGMCVLYPAGQINLPQLTETLSSNAVTTMFITAGLFDAWSEALSGVELPALREILTGGQAANLAAMKRVQAALPNAQIIHCYGPTENTTFTTTYRITERLTDEEFVPIGRSIRHTRTVVLNDKQQLVPQGVVGELYCGGVGVARGYLNQPEMTADKFIDNPFGEGRLYRTGDLVRYLPDGNIQFVGRVDNQVKIRGYRIELGEIESVLAQFDGLDQAVVVADTANNNLIAYVTGSGIQADNFTRDLLDFAKEQLPAYMLPAAVVRMDEFALTANGKTDRDKLPEATSQDFLVSEYVAPTSEIQNQLCALWCEVLQRDQIGIDDKFFDAGGNSLLSMKLQTRIVETMDVDISVTDIFTYPTIRSMAEYLGDDGSAYASAHVGADASSAASNTSSAANDAELGVAATPMTAIKEPIAVIGMALRFPDARTSDEFWQNLVNGHESLHSFTDEQLREAGINEATISDPNYIKKGFILDELDQFDADYFDFTPREVEVMDPQQRLLFEVTEQALQHAGYASGSAALHGNKVGVYVGVGENRYLLDNLLPQGQVIENYGRMSVLLGNGRDFSATRLSHRLNLTGPSLSIATACSTSLVAVAQAFNAIERGECSMAIAGGVSIHQLQPEGLQVVDGGIASLDGHCRPFDAAASGTRAGSGAGVVLLKPLSAAQRDGDDIQAIIKGVALNNDGGDKVGYTAPSVEGQSQVIAQALASAQVSADSIGYIETHGTGTKLGDPMEIAALKRVFGRSNASSEQPITLGALKANIGHLDAAAGVAGLIKAIHVVKHGVLPPNIHFNTLNPEIKFGNANFAVNAQKQAWPDSEQPRRAGISSFGIGGTNAHVVIEQPPALSSVATAPSNADKNAEAWQLLPLSTKNEAALLPYANDLAKAIEDVPLHAAAYTLQQGRAEQNTRGFVVANSSEQAKQALAMPAKATVPAANANVVFLMTGQGSQYVQMAKSLYAEVATFREQFDLCLDLLQPHLEQDLRALIFADDVQAAESALSQTAMTQPALFAVEYAMAKVWQSLGVTPKVMIGHSLGEYVAATLAGVFSLEDAAQLVAARGRLMQQAEAGAMLSVVASVEAVTAHIDALKAEGLHLDIAAQNGPQLTVVSGPQAAIDAIASKLSAQGVTNKALATSHAYHSASMDAVLPAFKEIVSKTQRNAPSATVMSNVSGTALTAEQAQSVDYWAQHLRGTVNFAANVANTLADIEQPVFVEVGPGRVLCDMVKRQSELAAHQLIHSLPRAGQAEADVYRLLSAIGQVWQNGVKVNWNVVRSLCTAANDDAQRVTLPAQPFMRKRFWIDVNPDAIAAPAANVRRVDDWFYTPTWQCQAGQLSSLDDATLLALTEQQSCVVFANDTQACQTLVSDIKALGVQVVTVKQGEQLVAVDSENAEFTLNAADRNQYRELMDQLTQSEHTPRLVIHAWNVCDNHTAPVEQQPIESQLQSGVYSVLYLAQALESLSAQQEVSLKLVASHMNRLDESDVVIPANAGLLPVSQVISQEFPGITAQSIDLHSADDEGHLSKRLRQRLTQVLCSESTQNPVSLVALKDNQIWLPDYQRVELDEQPEHSLARSGGVYFITGGLGGIGMAAANWLAEKYQAKLVLVGRSELPAQDTWSEVVADPATSPKLRANLQKLMGLKIKARAIQYHACDITSAEAVANLKQQVSAELGAINGVIHTAGVPGGGLMVIKDAADVQQVMAPKVQGTLNLLEQLSGDALDFFVNCSSLAGVIGEIAQYEYSAANAFQDAIAHQYRGDSTFVTSINWDAWGESGMAFNADVPDWMKANQADDLASAISDAEGQQIIARVLSHRLSQVATARYDINQRIVELAQPRSDEAEEQAEVSSAVVHHDRPSLATPYVAPSNEDQEKLAAIIENALGIKPVGIDDNFFDLGADSLLLVKVVSEINAQWQSNLSLKILFEVPTVAGVEGRLQQEEQEEVQEEASEVVEEGLI